MTDDELLLAMSEMMDKKLDPINVRLDRIEESQQSMERRLQNVEGRLQNIEFMQNKTALAVENLTLTVENNILPRLQNLESCYTSTYERYAKGVGKIDGMYEDIGIIKNVVIGHSKKLQQFA